MLRLDPTEEQRDVVDQIFELQIRDFSALAVTLHGKPASTAAQQA